MRDGDGDGDGGGPPALGAEIRILDARLPGWGFPHWGSAGAAGLDLHACLNEPLVLPPGGEPVLVPAGFAIRIGDPGWCGLVTPRSGLGHRGLVLGNGMGVIDADYEGPCLLSVLNRSRGGEPITVSPGDRIAQMVFVRVGRPVVSVVDAFSGSAGPGRGAGGFGSTGQAAVSAVRS